MAFSRIRHLSILMERITLDNSQIPLHYQIADYLLVMLDRGDLSHDERIPPEEELTRTFGVSRTTVRRALEHLLQKRLLYRKQGKGTFWTDSARKHRGEKLAGINRQIFNVNRETSVRVLSKRREAANPDVASILKIDPGSAVVTFERLRYINKEPMCFTVNYLPASFGEPIEKNHLEKKTMLETLEEVLGIELGTIEHEVEVTRASSDLAKRLSIPVLDPVLTIRTAVYDTAGKPIEVVWTHFIESRYKFRVVLEK